MDSSNAESTVTAKYHDAIVGDANRQLHALEGEVAALREQLAAAEAVIEKGRAEIRTGIGTGQAYRIQQILGEPPPVVLEDRDRENRAIGWDEGERHESEYLSEWGQFCPGEHCNPHRGDKQ